MTGEEIRLEAIRYNVFDIPEEDALAYINEGLRRLGDMGLVYGEIDVEAEKGVGYALPPDALNIVRVEHKQTKEPYYGYRTVGETIIFDRPGEYTIHARKMPEPLGFIDEEPDVHMLFHHSLVVYLRGITKLQDDETNQDGHNLLRKFEEEAVRASIMLQRRRSPKTVRVIR